MAQQSDEFDGKGGSYIIDPETGQRKPAEPVVDQPEAEQNEYFGKGGSYIIDAATGKPRPHDEREHLLIKPARPPATVTEPEQAPPAKTRKKR